MGEEVESVFHMGLVALPVAGQVDEDKLYIFVAESLELHLPSVHVATEPMNEAEGLGDA